MKNSKLLILSLGNAVLLAASKVGDFDITGFLVCCNVIVVILCMIGDKNLWK